MLAIPEGINFGEHCSQYFKFPIYLTKFMMVFQLFHNAMIMFIKNILMSLPPYFLLDDK